ncbi:metallopeptidase family protein [Patescibacteria group bacterium]|nr:metallopeptidase family protein [Patescibacteria group bacterium]
MQFIESVFEKYINQALDNLPKRFAEKIENLVMVFDDQLQPRKGQGIILANIIRSNFYPSKITFFKKNLEAVSPNERTLATTLHHVVFHELGHYFGMSEEQVRRKEQPINIYGKHATNH